jgi:hypothetical protein
VQLPPEGHELLHVPPEQSTLQAPAPHVVRQCPPEQSTVQAPVVAHWLSQPPPEQSVVHGAVAHIVAQCPLEQLHVPPVHAMLVSIPASTPGNGTTGPVDVLPPPQCAAVIETSEPTSATTSVRMNGVYRPTLALSCRQARFRTEEIPERCNACAQLCVRHTCLAAGPVAQPCSARASALTDDPSAAHCENPPRSRRATSGDERTSSPTLTTWRSTSPNAHRPHDRAT